MCLVDLEAYKSGTQLFKTHLGSYDTDVKVSKNVVMFKGQHHLTSSTLNHANLKSLFMNKLIANIKER